MIIIAALKFWRDTVREALQMRREAMKRYGFVDSY
jgi:hypothetical protein